MANPLKTSRKRKSKSTFGAFEKNNKHENQRLRLRYAESLRHRRLSSRTIETYSHDVKTFTEWLGRKSVKAASPADMESYRQRIAEVKTRSGTHLAVGTQAKMLTVVKEFYRFLRREKVVFTDPTRNLTLPKVPVTPPDDPLSLRDVRKLLELPASTPMNIRNRAIIYLLSVTGIRVSESTALNVSDINIHRRELLIESGKGEASRLVFFTPSCAVALNEYLQTTRPGLVADDPEPLFLSLRGRRLSRVDIGSIVNKTARLTKVNKRVHPHLFRHFLCSLLLERGASLRLVSEIAGHVKMSTTGRYLTVAESRINTEYRTYHPRSGV